MKVEERGGEGDIVVAVVGVVVRSGAWMVTLADIFTALVQCLY